MMMEWARDGWSWWEWLLMSIGMVAFWALVAWAVVAIVQRTRGASNEPDAEAILKERFARGEIDEDEYRRRQAALGEAGSYTTPRPGS